MTPHVRLVFRIVTLSLIAGCSAHRGSIPTVGPALPASSPRAAVTPASDTVLVIGRIELAPPLTREERALRNHDLRLANKALVVFSQQPLDLEHWPAESPPARVALPLGEDFVLPVPRSARLYYSGAAVLLATGATPGYGRPVIFEDRELRLSGRFATPIRADDRAIYIGTLRYARDDFGAVRPLQIVDEYASAQSRFVHTRGTDMPLRDVVPSIAR